MSEHLLINPTQLYFIYSPKDIKYEYFDFNFLPNYTSLDTHNIYDAVNCLSINDMNNLNLFIYKQWSLLKLHDDLPNNSRKKSILKILYSHTKVLSKGDLNEKLKEFILEDKVLGLYIINQLLKFLYPCKV
jgi:hypothetical protein|tara:strand:- start:1722 stop:2114 length:393 start_codon:yes stop_codon:yes gene_type:complete